MMLDEIVEDLHSSNNKQDFINEDPDSKYVQSS